MGITKLKSLAEESQYVCNNIKTFEFSTLHITIPHTRLKSNIKELIQRCFLERNGEQMYQYLVICKDKSYFVKSHSRSNNKYKHDWIIQIVSLTTYLFSLVDGCFINLLVFQIIRNVLHISFKDFSRIKIEN